MFEKCGQRQYRGADSRKSPHSSDDVPLLNPGSKRQLGERVAPMEPLGSILQKSAVTRKSPVFKVALQSA